MRTKRNAFPSFANLRRFRSRIPYVDISALVLLSCLTVANAISSSPPESEGVVKARPLTFVYECDQGGSFVASVTGESATIFVSGEPVRLPRVQSASGEKFETGGTTFWMKGNEAILDTPDTVLRNCNNNRMRAIWEDARLRGVDFRATGNEPGWYLEISGESQIVFVTDYGQSRYSFSGAQAPSDPHAQHNVLQAVNDKQRIELILQRMRCMDSMSDQQFDTRVTVRLDDREFRGCGNTLR
jgi:putative lipoprotein